MLNVCRLTAGAVLLVTLEIAATPTTALSPTNLESISGRYIAQNLHAHDSQVLNKELSSSGIEGCSTFSTMSGMRPIGVDRVKPTISPALIAIAILDQAGRGVTRIQPNKEGYFRVTLKPGTYRLAPELQQSDFLVLPNSDSLKRVIVTQGQFTPVKIEYTVLAP